jgi:hypothetical protein
MGYTESKVMAISEGGKNGTPADWGASEAPLLRVNQPCDLFAVGALITTVLDTNLSTITVTRRTLPGSDGSGVTAATVVATIIVPHLTAVGKIVYMAPLAAKTVANQLPVKLNAGDELQFSASAGGGSFKFRPWIEAYPRPETKANNSDFLLSA